MRFVWWTGFGLAAIIVILFAVSNKEVVSVGLWPVLSAIQMPLYLVLLGTLLVGFVVGELVAWLAGWHWRREARRLRDRVTELERELAETRTRIAP